MIKIVVVSEINFLKFHVTVLLTWCLSVSCLNYSEGFDIKICLILSLTERSGRIKNI
jgi:hypothetical protein